MRMEDIFLIIYLVSMGLLMFGVLGIIHWYYTLAYGFPINKTCFDSIMWGDNSTVGLPQNITEYCK